MGWGGDKKKTKWKPQGAKNDQDVFGFAHVCTKEGRASGTPPGAKNDYDVLGLKDHKQTEQQQKNMQGLKGAKTVS